MIFEIKSWKHVLYLQFHLFTINLNVSILEIDSNRWDEILTKSPRRKSQKNICFTNIYQINNQKVKSQENREENNQLAYEYFQAEETSIYSENKSP